MELDFKDSTSTEITNKETLEKQSISDKAKEALLDELEVEKDSKTDLESESKQKQQKVEELQDEIRLLFAPSKYQQNKTHEEFIIEDKELPSLEEDNLVLLPIDPYKLNAYWTLDPNTLNYLNLIGAKHFILRVYDVTGIIFNGYNAHNYWDFDCLLDAPNWYLPSPIDRANLCCELGYIKENTFYPILRSNTVYVPPKDPSPVVNDEFIVFKGHQESPQPYVSLEEEPQALLELPKYDIGLSYAITPKFKSGETIASSTYTEEKDHQPIFTPIYPKEEPVINIPKEEHKVEEYELDKQEDKPILDIAYQPNTYDYKPNIYEYEKEYYKHEVEPSIEKVELTYTPYIQFFKEIYTLPLDISFQLYKEVIEKYGIFPIYSISPEYIHIKEILSVKGPEAEKFKEVFLLKYPEFEYYKEIYYPSKPLFEHFKVLFEYREPLILHEITWDIYPPRVEVIKEYYNIHEKTYLISIGYLPITQFMQITGSEGLFKRFLGASELRFIGASERLLYRYPGASERWLYREFLGASEWVLYRYPGASERWLYRQFLGASEWVLYRYPGASERWLYRQFLGASEWKYLGASEWILYRYPGASERLWQISLGGSELRFIGASEKFLGASERFLGASEIVIGGTEKIVKIIQNKDYNRETKTHIFSSKYYI